MSCSSWAEHGGTGPPRRALGECHLAANHRQEMMCSSRSPSRQGNLNTGMPEPRVGETGVAFVQHSLASEQSAAGSFISFSQKYQQIQHKALQLPALAGVLHAAAAFASTFSPPPAWMGYSPGPRPPSGAREGHLAMSPPGNLSRDSRAIPHSNLFLFFRAVGSR